MIRNKADVIDEERQVATAEGIEAAKTWKIPFFEIRYMTQVVKKIIILVPKREWMWTMHL